MRNLFLLTALFAFAFSFGQDRNKKDQKREMIKQQKIAFITKEVGFTDKEAEKFWPDDYIYIVCTCTTIK